MRWRIEDESIDWRRTMSDELTTRIIYDGDCPFCSAYVRMVRLQQSVGPIELINARQNKALSKEMKDLSLSLDEGMILDYQGQYYHGEDCVEKLALLSTSSGFFNRINAVVFRRRWLARVLYPILRSGRNFYLKLAGIKPISLN